MRYEDLNLIIPKESTSYKDDSDFIIRQIQGILDTRKEEDRNRLIFSSNLRRGLPLGPGSDIIDPILEAWADEIKIEIEGSIYNRFYLDHVQSHECKYGMADVVFQFTKSHYIVGDIKVIKIIANTVRGRKGPNIAPFSKLRTAYVKDPDSMFIILSIRYDIFFRNSARRGFHDNIIEIKDYSIHDLKYIGEDNLQYRLASGAEQVQLKDIHNAAYQYRTAWELCQMLDRKYLQGSRRSIEDFYREAKKNKWIAD